MAGNQKIFNFTAVDNGVATFYDKVNAKAKEFNNLASSTSQQGAANQRNQLDSLKEYIANLQKAIDLERKRQADLTYAWSSQASRYAPSPSPNAGGSGSGSGSNTPGMPPGGSGSGSGSGSSSAGSGSGGSGSGTGTGSGGSSNFPPGGSRKKPIPVFITNWNDMPNYNTGNGTGTGAGAGGSGTGSGNSGGSSSSGSIVGSILTADVIKGAFKYIKNALGELGTATATAQNEDAYVGKVFGLLPGAGSMLEAAKERQLNAEREREQSRLSSLALTGQGGVGSMSQFGLTTPEANQMAMQVARSGGNARNLRARTENLLGLQYGFGLDQGTLLQQEQQARLTGGSAGNNVASIITTLQERGIIKNGDFSQLEDLIRVQNSFIQTQAQNLNNPNANIATGIVTAFKNAGFETPRLEQIIGRVNQSIVNPQNDFAKAENFAALASLPGMQGASFLEFQKAQEKGLEQEGFLGAILKQQKQRYGSGESQVLAASNKLGLSANDAQILIDAFNADETAFDKRGKTSILQDVLGKQQGKLSTVQGTETGESTGVAVFAQQRVRIEEAFADNFVNGIVTAFQIAGPKLRDEIMDAMSMVGDMVKGNAPSTDKTKDTKNRVVKSGARPGVGGDWD